jgi:AcrR family transcriptional regulator
MSPQETKAHILLSTINAIEKYGLANLTTRMIADEAGVNNAALHYYFGTKEKLIHLALRQTAEHMLGDVREILDGEAPIADRITECLEYMIEGVLRYPNLIRAHMIGPLFNQDRQEDLAHLLRSWMDLTVEAVQPHVPEDHTARVRLSLNMTFSMILMSGLLLGQPEAHGWLDLGHPAARRRLVRESVRNLLLQEGGDEEPSSG